MTTTTTSKPYGVKCYRSAHSVFGAAEAWLKSKDSPDGLDRYATLEEAQARASELNCSTCSVNVGYQAAKISGAS